MEFSTFEQVHRNLWRRYGIYYRLYASQASPTPNGCWLIAPKMVELADIDAATGKDVIGPSEVVFEVCGTVPACYEFVSY
jgi:hypothetical protein